MRMTITAILLVIATTASSVLADECPNRNYCHTPGIKYRSFQQMPGMFLNSTNYVLRTFQTNTSGNCLNECTRTENCQSTNYYLETNKTVMSCDLINGNKWSNASLLVSKENSTHNFIEGPCSSNPCENGGTCISRDQENKYTCACIDGNFTTTIHGSHCETVKAAEKTADAFINFEQHPVINVVRPTGSSFYTYGSSKKVPFPDSKSNVLYLPGISGSYSRFSGVSGCPMSISSCFSSPNTGLTVSFWFRILKRSQSKFSTSSCQSVYTPLVHTTSHISSYRGFRVTLYGCRKDAIFVSARDYGRSISMMWGNAYNETLYSTWSHFAFTLHNSQGLAMYFNGEEVARKTSFTGQSGLSSTLSYLEFGNSAAGNLEVYMDEMSMWFQNLLPTDIKFVYQKGLGSAVLSKQ